MLNTKKFLFFHFHAQFSSAKNIPNKNEGSKILCKLLTYHKVIYQVHFKTAAKIALKWEQPAGDRQNNQMPLP